MVLAWVFDIAPRACPRPRHRRGRSYMPAEYEVWKRAVSTMALAAGREPLSVPCSVSIQLHEWRRNADVDNYAKAILDALRGRFWTDDNCAIIQRLTVSLCRTDAGGFTVAVVPL